MSISIVTPLALLSAVVRAAAGPAAGYVLHGLGQSNAVGYAPGTPFRKNAIGMTLADGTLLSATNDPGIADKFGIESVLMETWTEASRPIYIEQAQGGIRADTWMDNHLAPWRAQVAALTVPTGYRHVVLWIQGESDAFELVAEQYEAEQRAVFEAFRETLPGCLIVDVLLSPDYVWSQRTSASFTPNYGQLKPQMETVNEAKRALSAEFDAKLIGGGLGATHFETDRVHYSEAGLVELARQFRGAVAGAPVTDAGGGAGAGGGTGTGTGSGTGGGTDTGGTGPAFKPGFPSIQAINSTAVQIRTETVDGAGIRIFLDEGTAEPTTQVYLYGGFDRSVHNPPLTGLTAGTRYTALVEVFDANGTVRSDLIAVDIPAS